MCSVETMIELLAAAEGHGDRPALVFEGQTLSFQALAAKARAAAGRLHELGVRPGDRVSIYAPSSLAWVVSYFGVFAAGAVANPVNALNTVEELEFITADCEARLVLVDAVRAPQLALRALPRVATLDRPLDGFSWLDTAAAAASGAASCSPDDPCTITYTSGTTGRPKGAVLSHRAVALNAVNTALMHDRSAKDRMLTALPLAHAYGAAVMNSALLVGAPLFFEAKFEPLPFLRLLESSRATVMDGVPTMYAYLLQLPELADADLSALRCLLVGGQSMPAAAQAAVAERFRAPLVELWGMTEIAGLGSTHDLRKGLPGPGIGVALPGMELRIADADDPSRTLAAGEIGELSVRGPTLMDGYWKQPEATAAAITPDGWLQTGDLAFQHPTGEFEIVDRKKDMILCGGYNVYPAEIERVLTEHPDVALCAVGRGPDPARGEVPIAYVVLRAGARPDAEELLSYCRTRIAKYKLPRELHFVADLPKTSTGKIMRRALGAEGRHA